MSNAIGKNSLFSGVKDGDVFTVAGMEFIKFASVNGKTPAVMKNAAFSSRYGANNDLRSSIILQRMEEEILPPIMDAVGAENVCSFYTDLTTLDGLKPYGELHSYISLPTFDFYRNNVEIFDKYKMDNWWWLATPESAEPHSERNWIVCVAPSGCIRSDYSTYGCAVRPFCIFDSSIFDSCEE